MKYANPAWAKNNNENNENNNEDNNTGQNNNNLDESNGTQGTQRNNLPPTKQHIMGTVTNTFDKKTYIPSQSFFLKKHRSAKLKR